MSFEYPSLLWMLLLLIIPILIHLIQFRRYKRVVFTNLKALKQLDEKTKRKRNLRDLLLLMIRLAMYTCIILAAAGPIDERSLAKKKTGEHVVLLDNSFSMQRVGQKGNLLEEAKDKLVQWAHTLSYDSRIFLLTFNPKDGSVYALSPNEFIQEVIRVDFTAQAQDINRLRYLIKKSKAMRDGNSTVHVYSDQRLSLDLEEYENTLISEHILSPANLDNLVLDTLFVFKEYKDKTDLALRISNEGEGDELAQVAVMLNKEKHASFKIGLKSKSDTLVHIQIPLTTPQTQGEIRIGDRGMSYDNSLFFSLDLDQNAHCLLLQDQRLDGIQSLFEAGAYTLEVPPAPNTINVGAYSLILVNEAPVAASSSIPVLKKHLNDGGNICWIPDQALNTSVLTTLLEGKYKIRTVDKTVKIREILSDRVFFNDVFSDEIPNFYSPSFDQYIELNGEGIEPLILFSNNAPFLLSIEVGNGRLYLFTCPLEETGFYNTDLPAASIYRVAELSAPRRPIYSVVNSDQEYMVKYPDSNSESVLTLERDAEQFLPQQHRKGNFGILNARYAPEWAGNYNVTQNSIPASIHSFNYARSENDLQKSVQLAGKTVDSKIEDENKSDSKWSWSQLLLLLAVAFMLCELLFIRNPLSKA